MDGKLTKTQNLILRIFSMLVLYPVVVWSLVLGQWTTLALIFIVGSLSMVEWFRMSIKAETLPKAVTYLLLGNAYIFIGFFLLWLISTQLNWIMMTVLLTLTFLSDIGGFIFGSILKGPKLVPHISPNKTWTGALGAICLTVAGGYATTLTPYYDTTFLNGFPAPLLCLMISIVAQLGDLIESWTKRKLNVKDSSHLIPGHGGILDRVDSVLAVSYLVAILMWVMG